MSIIKRNAGEIPDSDLALERRAINTDIPGVDYEREESGACVWERITVRSREGEAALGRPRGRYDTLTLMRMDLLGEDEIREASDGIAEALWSLTVGMCPEKSRLLCVGLGNGELTPDAVGPRTAELINATMHIKELDKGLFCRFGCSEIAVFSPGVMAKTGMETSSAIRSIVSSIKPDIILAVDALASRSAQRLGTTVQISDTGIFPGSGIGNRRMPLDKKTLGIPVIALGVPTVINTRNLTDGKSIPGCFVSPKEIDLIVKAAATIISGGINKAFGIL